LKDSVDDLMLRRGWECRLIAKVHFGTVIAGPFGAAGDKRPDVIGKAVNVAAMLDSTGVSLSVEAFRKLGPEVRALQEAHTADHVHPAPGPASIQVGDPCLT
jgi:hypothetical protein